MWLWVAVAEPSSGMDRWTCWLSAVTVKKLLVGHLLMLLLGCCNVSLSKEMLIESA